MLSIVSGYYQLRDTFMYLYALQHVLPYVSFLIFSPRYLCTRKYFQSTTLHLPIMIPSIPIYPSFSPSTYRENENGQLLVSSSFSSPPDGTTDILSIERGIKDYAVHLCRTEVSHLIDLTTRLILSRQKLFFFPQTFQSFNDRIILTAENGYRRE